MAQSNYATFDVSRTASRGWVSMCETEWGYIVRSDTKVSRRSATIERMCGLTGLAFLAAVSAQWMIPMVNAATPIALSMSKTAASIGLFMPALMFLWISERGLAREVQIDTERRTLRICAVNRKGVSRTLRDLPFDSIKTAYIKKVGSLSQLFLRVSGQKQAVHIANGSDVTLREVHKRLNLELGPVKTQMQGWSRVGRRLRPMATA